MILRPAVKYLFLVLTFLIIFVGLSCCKKKKDPEKDDPSVAVFDKKAMLENYASSCILPEMALLQTRLNSVRDQFSALKSSGSAQDLESLRKIFHDTYKTYQRASIYTFGPAEDEGIRINFNIYPADTARINANISSGSYDLATAANTAAKGFPALEYLLYRSGRSTENIAAEYKSNAALQLYTEALLNEMKIRTDRINNAWNSGYRETFVKSLGTEVGSSIGFLVNQVNYELDNLKNAKLATPLGLRSGGAPLPDQCEGFYSGYSLQYAIESLRAIENLYRGNGIHGNGSGFDDYLVHLNSQHVNGSLAAAVDSQFAATYSKLNALNDPLSQQVVSNKQAVESAYRELVKLLVLLKTDMPSALGVVITYQDGDGD